MNYRLKISEDGYADYQYQCGSESYVRAFCSEQRAKDIIADKAEIGPLTDFPIKAGKFHFAGVILEENAENDR